MLSVVCVQLCALIDVLSVSAVWVHVLAANVLPVVSVWLHVPTNEVSPAAPQCAHLLADGVLPDGCMYSPMTYCL